MAGLVLAVSTKSAERIGRWPGPGQRTPAKRMFAASELPSANVLLGNNLYIQ
jgi:hypothetical protein